MGSDETKAFEITGSLFFNCVSLLFLYELFTVLEFQKERAVFIREYYGRMYGSVIYYVSKLAVEIPMLILLPLLELLISFWGIEYRQEAFL